MPASLRDRILRMAVALAVRAASAVVVVGAVAALDAGSALAEGRPSLDGRWSASPLTARWVIGDWGSSCGPRPSGGGEPATSVTVREASGELVIAGGGRTFSTAQCWEQYPGMGRVGHTASPRAWKTSCKTAPGDPRQASLSTSVTATDSSLSFYEAGQYQFVIQGQNCTASVGRYRTYTLVERAGAPPSESSEPAAKASPPPQPKKEAPKRAEPSGERCRAPGPPARLEVRPARKLLRAGEEFAFRALVSDAAGCSVTAKPTWAIEAGQDRAELTSPGTVRLKADATEGEVRLTASVGGRSAEVTIEVASADRYDALLQSGAFNAAGEVDEAASVAIASQAIGAASAVAEDHASGRKKIFVAIVGIIALLLLGVGAYVLTRARRAARAQEARYEAQRAKYEEALNAAPSVPPEPQPVAPPSAAEPPRPKRVCPVCGLQYEGNERFCGKDGATLVPVN